MRISNDQFARIVADARARHNMSDVAGRHTTLKKRGARELVGLCPFHEERSPSFEVNNTKGTFYCHGCGKGGDAITLLTDLEHMSFMDAVRWLSGDALPVVTEEERAKRRTVAAAEVQDRINLARSIWANACPVADTPAETYLITRGIDPNVPSTVRFVATPRWRDEETGECGRDVPALACALQSASGELVGVQCVFLDKGGSEKFERQRPDGSRAKAKLSFGLVAGSALRLGPVRDEIVICEGPEDGLTLSEQLRGRTVWVSCGTAMMAQMQFPAEVGKIVLAGDNGHAGHEAVVQARSAFEGQGLSTSAIFPDARFKDWNDEARGIAIA